MNKPESVKMKTTLLSGAFALSSLAVSQAVVVWADDYTTDRIGGPNTYDYAGGAAGTDYNFSLGGNTSNVAGGVWNIGDTSSNGTSAFVTTSQWTARPVNNGDQIVLSFDMRVNSLSGLSANSASVPRVGLFQNADTDGNVHSAGNGALFTVGFGTVGLADGDANTDLSLYAVAGDISAVPSAGNALGFTGSGWTPGFDFGDYDGTTATNNDTGGFLRFSLTFTEGSNVVNGTITNLATSQTLTFTRNAASAVDFSDVTNARDGLRIGSGQGGQGNMDFDNVSIEILSVPEPSAALLVGACGLLGLLRRRRA